MFVDFEPPRKRSQGRVANHAPTRTTQLYDRRTDELTLEEVERILI
jgi:hypothetical protein